MEFPTVVLIRDPQDAVVSSIVKRLAKGTVDIDTAIQCDLDSYYEYYSFVLDRSNELTVYDFEDLIVNPEGLVELIAGLLNSKAPTTSEIRVVKKDIYDELSNDKRKDGSRNLRSAYKDKQKRELLILISSNKKLKQCSEIHKLVLGTHRKKTV